MSCGYQGYEFGAAYLDSVCIDGYLWNADSGESAEDGWMYDHGGELPCPVCRFREVVRNLAAHMREAQWCKKFDKFELHGTKGNIRQNHKLIYNRARRQVRSYLVRNGYGD